MPLVLPTVDVAPVTKCEEMRRVGVKAASTSDEWRRGFGESVSTGEIGKKPAADCVSEASKGDGGGMLALFDRASEDESTGDDLRLESVGEVVTEARPSQI